MNKKAIFYDLDNTIYPQIIDIEQRIDYCLKKFAFRDEKIIKTFWINEWLENGPVKKDLIDIVIKKFGLNVNKEKFLNTYITYKTNLSLTEKHMELFKKIKNLNFKQFVITNGNPVIQLNKINSLKLHQFFDEIIIATGEYAKPCNYWFKQLMFKYKLNPDECISVGDWYAIDGIASLSAGITFIYKEGGHVIENVPEHIDKIKDLTEILRYVT